MVKMRYLFIISVCIHGLLALSIGQYIQSPVQEISHNFSVTLLTSSKSTNKEINTTPKKIFVNKSQKKNPLTITKPTAENATSVPPVIYNPAPAYPVNARTQGEEGIFSVKILVGVSGKVAHVEIVAIKGKRELFEEELLSTLKTWQFKPCNQEISFEIPISFQLSE